MDVMFVQTENLPPTTTSLYSVISTIPVAASRELHCVGEPCERKTHTEICPATL